MTDDVLVSVEGGVGRIRLNRPKAIHALTHGMCLEMSTALAGWAKDPAVGAVLLDHAEGRGFCSGGDIALIRHSVLHDGGQSARRFFFDEYRLNHQMFTWSKPIVAFMDGITMGGGVGISQPARLRVSTENTRFAMPETGIGLLPDVGGGWYLSRLPGRVGQYMVLTGARFDGTECHYLGMATHYVEQTNLEDLVDRIMKAPGRVQGSLGAASTTPPEGKVADKLATISRIFASDSLEEILKTLAGESEDWADELATIGTKSPLSCKVSLRLLAEGANRVTFTDEMRAEYALAGRVVRTHDFREGVRALLIDKSGDPQWDPATPEEVTEEMLDVLFAPLPPSEEWTPFPETETVE